MENRANYFLVGIFVFIVFFSSLGFMLWLGGGTAQKEDFEYYEIHTNESVSGLSQKAPVKLLGVEVGSVENIHFKTKDDLQVIILIKVQKNTPIREDTEASLQLQGITGIKFVQLQGGNKDSKFLKSEPGKIAVIKYKSNILENLTKQSDHLFSLVKRADEKAAQILSDENVENLRQILENLQILSKALKDAGVNLGEKFEQSASDVSFAAKNIDKNFEQLSKQINDKMNSYDDLRDVLQSDLELLRNLLLEGNLLLENLRQSPSNLLFKAQKPKLGPGEK